MGALWNGQSVHQLRLSEARLKRLTDAVAELLEVRDEAHGAYKTEIGRLVGRDPDVLELGHWPCTGSPIRLCMYDMSTDERDEECLFCGQPDERK
jgi:hypothetical protein